MVTSTDRSCERPFLILFVIIHKQNFDGLKLACSNWEFIMNGYYRQPMSINTYRHTNGMNAIICLDIGCIRCHLKRQASVALPEKISSGYFNAKKLATYRLGSRGWIPFEILAFIMLIRNAVILVISYHIEMRT